MQLFCPTCQSAFTGVPRCPRCGGLLLLPEEASAGLDGPARGPEVHFTPTPTARVVVGTVVALGLYLGLRRVTTGWVHATESDPAGWWTSADGLTAVFGLQAVAGLFGALLAGAGRAKGFGLGATVGLLCGGLFLAAEVAGGVPPGQMVLYLQPLILAAGGGLAGAVGSRVWAAVPELDMPAPMTKKLSSIQLDTGDPEKNTGRPTAWLRVLVGAAIIAAGVGFADEVRVKAQKASRGALKVESVGQGRLISLQMAALAALAGGVIAGAGTGAGLRHGVFAGVLGATGVIGLAASQGALLPPPAVYVFNKLELASDDPQDPATLVAVGSAVVATGVIGGWLGGTLFLALAPAHMRNRKVRFGGD